MRSASDDPEAALDSQYWRANVDPSDQYVQSLPASGASRLQANESGYRNLFLAGDWINCGLNAGCIESAVMAGVQAANAVRGRRLTENLLGQWYGLALMNEAMPEGQGRDRCQRCSRLTPLSGA